MNTLFALLIFLIFLFSCNSNKSSGNETLTKINVNAKDICYVSDSLTIDIVNQIISQFKCWNEKYSEKVILDNNILPIDLGIYREFLKEAIDSGFNVIDSTYVLDQVKKELDGVYNPENINAVVVPSDTVINWQRNWKVHELDSWSKFREKYKSGIMIIDKPIINKNKNEAVISFSYSLGGDEGTYELWIYRLKNKKWHKYKLIHKAVS